MERLTAKYIHSLQLNKKHTLTVFSLFSDTIECKLTFNEDHNNRICLDILINDQLDDDIIYEVNYQIVKNKDMKINTWYEVTDANVANLIQLAYDIETYIIKSIVNDTELLKDKEWRTI